MLVFLHRAHADSWEPKTILKVSNLIESHTVKAEHVLKVLFGGLDVKYMVGRV